MKKIEDIISELRKEYPNGHPDFIPLTIKEMELHSIKNFDYAHGGDPLGNFQRVADILSHYPWLDLGKPEVVAAVYMMKQLDAALWLMSHGHEAKIEGVGERIGDVSIYAKLIGIMINRSKDNEGA